MSMLDTIISIVIGIMLLVVILIFFMARVAHNIAEMDHGYYMDETLKK